MPISPAQYAMLLARTQPVRRPPDDIGDQPESRLHEQIMDYCRSKGWLCIHSRMDRPTTQQRGVADCIVITPRTVAFVELKRKGRKCSMDQLAFAAQVKKLRWPHAVVYTLEEFTGFMATLESNPRL